MLVLINLDSAVERRHVMARQLAGIGLEFERVGIDMRFVRPADIDERVARAFPGLRFDRQALSNAEIGCWLSHLTAWRRLLEQPAKPACTVVEDDVTLLPDFRGAVAALTDRSQFDLVYLGTSSRNLSQRRTTAIGGYRVHDPVGVILNTWGYSITRDYAARFFREARGAIGLPIDHFLGGRGPWARPHIGVLQPPVVREDPVLGVASQIGPYTRRFDRSRWFERTRRRLMASPVSEIYYALYRYL
jgi:glycosyl transferase family 25